MSASAPEVAGNERNPTLIGPTVDGAAPGTYPSASDGLDAQASHLESSNVSHDRKGWWARVQRGLAESEYQASMTDQGLQAPNRAHNLRSYFKPGGVRIHDRTTTGRSELAALSLVGIGRGDVLTQVAAGTVTHSGSRIEIRRPGVVEWYENSARGLEQGFTLAARPAGTGMLKLELAIDNARAAIHRDSVVLTTDAGRRLRYGALAVIDAGGRTIASHFEVPAPNRVRLIVDDTDAVYPLVIDPLITAVPDAILESNQAWSGSFDAALMGASVSGAGDVNGDGFADVIVGAPLYSSSIVDPVWGLLGVDGGAFVFLGGPNGMAGTGPDDAHARIISDALQSNLGFSVSGAGDINNDGFGDIIVGAPKYGIPFPPNIPPNDRQGNGGAALVFLAVRRGSPEPVSPMPTLGSLRIRQTCRKRAGQRWAPAYPGLGMSTVTASRTSSWARQDGTTAWPQCSSVVRQGSSAPTP